MFALTEQFYYVVLLAIVQYREKFVYFD